MLSRELCSRIVYAWFQLFWVGYIIFIAIIDLFRYRKHIFRCTTIFEKYKEPNFDKCVEHVIDVGTGDWTGSMAHFGEQKGYVANTVVDNSHIL